MLLTIFGIMLSVTGMAYSFYRIGHAAGTREAWNEYSMQLAELASESVRQEKELAKMEVIVHNLKNNLYAEGKSSD